MRALLALLSAAVLMVGSYPGWAHGDEPHGGDGANIQTTQEDADEARPTAGAAVSTPAATDASPPAEGATATEPTEPIFALLGQLHPATVHFPIALLLAAAATELFRMVSASASASAAAAEAVRVMVWGGAAGAVVAAAFGWLHTGLWFGGGAVMQWHRWTGTALALAAPLAAVLMERGSPILFRVLLFAIALALIGQGFLGGELAHGPNHLGL